MSIVINETDIAALAAGAARVVYASRLALGGSRTTTQNYLLARGLARDWVGEQYGGWPDAVDKANGLWQPEPGHTVSVRTWRADQVAAATVLTVERPHDDTDLLVKRTVLSAVATGDAASLTVQQALAAAPGVDTFGGPVEFSLTPPDVVSTVLDRLVVVDGGRRLSPGAWKAFDGSTVAAFIRHPDRALPVVVSQPFAEGRRNPHIDEIRQRCLGLAHVVELTRPGAIYGLIENLGPGSGIAPGAIRVYWPGFAMNLNSQTWHADFQVGNRRGDFPAVFAQRLYMLSSFWVQPPPAIETIRVAERRARTAQIASRAREQGTAEFTDEFLAEYDRDLARLAKLEQDLATCARNVGRRRGA